MGIWDAALDETFINGDLPRTREAFMLSLEGNRGQLVGNAGSKVFKLQILWIILLLVDFFLL